MKLKRLSRTIGCSTARLLAGLMVAGVGLSALGAADQALAVRQLGVKPDGRLELLAQAQRGRNVEKLDVLELKSDQVTPVRPAFSVEAFKASQMIFAEDYPFGKPSLNVFIVPAGDFGVLSDFVRQPDFVGAVKEKFARFNSDAVKVWALRPDAAGTWSLDAVDDVEKNLTALGGSLAEACPGGWFGWLRSDPYMLLQDAIAATARYADTDAKVNQAAKNLALILWAGDKENDIIPGAVRAAAAPKLPFVVVEVRRPTTNAQKFARDFAIRSSGSYLSRSEMRDMGDSGMGNLGQLVLETAVSTLSDTYLFTVDTTNPEQALYCWYNVGAVGSDNRSGTVACRRDVDRVTELVSQDESKKKAAFEKWAQELKGRGEDHAKKRRFADAYAVVLQIKQKGGDAAGLKSQVDAMLAKEIVRLADAFDFDQARGLLRVLADNEGETKSSAKHICDRLKTRAVDLAGKQLFPEAFALVGTLREMGEDETPTKNQIYTIINQNIERSANAFNFTQAMELLSVLAKNDGSISASAGHVSKMLKARAVDSADRKVYEEVLAAVSDLVKLATSANSGVSLDEELREMRRDVAKILCNQALGFADKREFQNACDWLAAGKPFGTEKENKDLLDESNRQLARKWSEHAVALAAKGDYDGASRQADELERLKMLACLSEEALPKLREDLLFTAAKWSMEQRDGKPRAADYASRWVEKAKASGRYSSNKARADESAWMLAQAFGADASAGAVAKTAEAYNELLRLEPARGGDAAVLAALADWLCKGGGDVELTRRISMIEDWDFAAAALKKLPDLHPSRFFAFAGRPVNDTGAVGAGASWLAADAEAELKRLRAESLEKYAELFTSPEYSLAYRSLALTQPLHAALRAALSRGVPVAEIEGLLQKSIADVNMRETALYRVTDVAQEAFLVKAPVKVFVPEDGSLGHGVKVAPEYLARLASDHAASYAPSVFFGNEVDSSSGGVLPVAILIMPLGDGFHFLSIVFQPLVAPYVKEEAKDALRAIPEESVGRKAEVALAIYEVRDAEFFAHWGLEFLSQMIGQVGVETFLKTDGAQMLEAFNASVPAAIRGHLSFEPLVLKDGQLSADSRRAISVGDVPSSRKRSTLGGYALWQDPFFEVGLTVTDQKDALGALRAGFKTRSR
jgi:hypothetical protein